jgi:hypothetical protein
VKSQLGKGKYVGAYTMKGEPPKGEAVSEYTELQSAAAEYALDALKKQKVPAAQRDFVRGYYDSLRIEKLGDRK